MEGKVNYQFDQEKYVNVYMFPPNEPSENMQGECFRKVNDGYADCQIGDGKAIVDDVNFPTENQDYDEYEEYEGDDEYKTAQPKPRKNKFGKFEYVSPLAYDCYQNEVGDYRRPDPADAAKYAKDMCSSKLASVAGREEVIRRYRDYREKLGFDKEQHASKPQTQYITPLSLDELQGSFKKSYQLDKRKSQATAASNKTTPEIGFKNYNRKLLHLFSDLSNLRDTHALSRNCTNKPIDKPLEFVGNKEQSRTRSNNTLAQTYGRSLTYDAIAEHIAPKRKSEIEVKYQNDDFEITYEEKKDENENPEKSQDISTPTETPKQKQTKIPKPVYSKVQPLSSSTGHNIKKKYSYCEKIRGPSVTILGSKNYQRAKIAKNVNDASTGRPSVDDKSEDNTLSVVKSDMLGKFLNEIRDFHLQNISQEVKRLQYLEFLPKMFFKK